MFSCARGLCRLPCVPTLIQHPYVAKIARVSLYRRNNVLIFNNNNKNNNNDKTYNIVLARIHCNRQKPRQAAREIIFETKSRFRNNTCCLYYVLGIIVIICVCGGDALKTAASIPRCVQRKRLKRK